MGSTRRPLPSYYAHRVRIMRTSMNTLTQMWMTLLLSNVLPSDHNSDLSLSKCQLVYAILTWMSVHVAQLISTKLDMQLIVCAFLACLLDLKSLSHFSILKTNV